MIRNTALLIAIIFAAVSAYVCQPGSANDKPEPCKFLSFADAERIIGQPVELVKNSWTFPDGNTKFACTYRSVGLDKTSGKEINLYFLLEEDATEEASKEAFKKIRTSNEAMPKFEVLTGYGDEGFSQNDRPNFYFLMARKGKFSIRLKLNKAAEWASFDEFRNYAKKLLEGMK